MLKSRYSPCFFAFLALFGCSGGDESKPLQGGAGGNGAAKGGASSSASGGLGSGGASTSGGSTVGGTLATGSGGASLGGSLGGTGSPFAGSASGGQAIGGAAGGANGGAGAGFGNTASGGRNGSGGGAGAVAAGGLASGGVAAGGSSGSNNGAGAAAGSTSAPTFTMIYSTIITAHCGGSGCHLKRPTPRDYDFSTKSSAYTSWRADVFPGDGLDSPLFQVLNLGIMPMNGPSLSVDELYMVLNWINAGALNN